MDCVVAPQRLSLRELRCTLDEFLGHLNEMEVVDERNQLGLGNVQLGRRKPLTPLGRSERSTGFDHDQAHQATESADCQINSARSDPSSSTMSLIRVEVST